MVWGVCGVEGGGDGGGEGETAQTTEGDVYVLEEEEGEEEVEDMVGGVDLRVVLLLLCLVR